MNGALKMRRDPHAIGRIVLVVLLTGILPCFARGQTQPSANCQSIAAPPPLATLGGPATVAPGNNELGLAVGAAGEIYTSPCGHE